MTFGRGPLTFGRGPLLSQKYNILQKRRQNYQIDFENTSYEKWKILYVR